MPRIKRMVCLANSRKLHGRCIAGVELIGRELGAWLRPVSAREHQEVSEYERQYQDGSDPQLLDIIDVPLLEACPKDYQQENWELDDQFYWTKIGSFAWGNLQAIAKGHATLWSNGCHTYNGLNDQIPLHEARRERDSLRLIRVCNLELRVFAPGAAFGNAKRRVQARFTFAGVDYGLWVTDPRVEKAFLRKPDGAYPFVECLLTVSLGEPFGEHAHKLVAAVIERPE